MRLPIHAEASRPGGAEQPVLRPSILCCNMLRLWVDPVVFTVIARTHNRRRHDCSSSDGLSGRASTAGHPHARKGVRRTVTHEVSAESVASVARTVGTGPRWHLAGRLTLHSPCKLTCRSRMAGSRSFDALQAALDAWHHGAGCIPSQPGMVVRPRPIRDQGLDLPGPAWVIRSGPLRQGRDRDASRRRGSPRQG
jgi:hypothetical protein